MTTATKKIFTIEDVKKQLVKKDNAKAVLKYLLLKKVKITDEILQQRKEYKKEEQRLFDMITGTDDISILAPVLSHAFIQIELAKKSLDYAQNKSQYSQDSLNYLIQDIKSSYFYLWKVIAKGTSLINPSLEMDLQRNPQRFESISEADLCWIHKNWKLKKESKCLHCGTVH